MRVGTLVNHENYFGVGVVTHIRKVNRQMQFKVYWLTEEKDFGWSWVENSGVEVLCK